MTEGETIKDLREKVKELEREFQEALVSKDRRKIGSLANRIHRAQLKLAATEAGEDIERDKQKKKKISLSIKITMETEELLELLRLFSKEV